MITFCIAFVCLLLGYLLYGSFMEKVVGADSQAPMPCYEKKDGVDYIPLSTWRVFLIQFLNIAGTGPIFGAIMGILFGPVAYLWIVLGCVFAGAVHDYMSGMICIRMGGASLPEIIGSELGETARFLLRAATIVLVIMVGAVFVVTPASLLGNMFTSQGFLWSDTFWIVVIFVYYAFATFLPIDKLIGKIYPLFGFALLAMAVGIGWNIFAAPGNLPEFTDGTFVSHHPSGLSIFPMLFVTIACGAISGFHGTQTPLMARCLKNERYGRRVFYGSMITEGLVALIWAAAAIKFADSLPGEDGATAYQKLAALGNPAVVVNKISTSWLGAAGAILAVLGVVAAPITSGDTAFRSARLMAADFLHIKQRSVFKRLMLSLPIFAVAVCLMFIDFNVLWRYFAWTNQTLGCLTLWAITVWLCHQHKCFWITLIPALFMTVVCASYIIVAPEGFQLPLSIGISVGFLMAILCALLFWIKMFRK